MIIKNVTVLHGYGVSPEKMWFPWIHAELEKRGLAVNIPAMPNPLRPSYKDWHRVAAPIARRWDSNTLVIGHSVGGAFALRLIEREARERIAGLILIGSPFTATINVKPYVKFFAQPMDWVRISGMVEKISLIHAKNDPLVPYDHAVRYGEAFGTKPILTTKGGHFTEKTCSPIRLVLKKDFAI